MKLERMRLHNFRQFHGSASVEFSIQEDQNVTVVHGVNGAGKTSLFSAINWCLYDAGVDEIGELFCKRALVEAEPGDDVAMYVEVTFSHEGDRYIARRSMRRKAGAAGHLPRDAEFALTEIGATGDSLAIPNPIGRMNSILPEDVRPYFFFDGEKMDDLTRADGAEVGEAIRNIMRLPALERAEMHLGAIATGLRREIRRQSSSDLEQLVAQEEDLRGERETTARRRDDLSEEIRLGRRHISELDDRLRDTAEARQIQARRDEIDALLARMHEQEAERLAEIQTSVSRGYAALLAPAIQDAIGSLEEKRNRGEIPSGVREQFLKDVLEDLVCVCGREFQAGDPVYRRLEDLLHRTPSSQLVDVATRLSSRLQGIVDSRLPELVESVRKRAREHSSFQAEAERLGLERDDASRRLGRSDNEDVRKLESRRREFQSRLESDIASLAQCDLRMTQISDELQRNQEGRRKAQAREDHRVLLHRREKLAQDAADAVTNIKSQFIEETRRQVGDATREVFAELAWKQEHFADVTLDDDFRLEVIDRWGLPTRRELSAGERQVLSLSFICAMARVAGEDAPLVMDTPFGRLSRNHLSVVAENLPDLTSQLILFVTDREWDEASRTGLEPRAGVQSRLHFDNETGCTVIEEVKW